MNRVNDLLFTLATLAGGVAFSASTTAYAKAQVAAATAPAKSPDAPYDITVPGTNYDLDFMVKDSTRFPDSGGWGYAVFKYDTASGMYTPATQTHKPPQGNNAKCGTACHMIAKPKDYVFTEYAKR